MIKGFEQKGDVLNDSIKAKKNAKGFSTSFTASQEYIYTTDVSVSTAFTRS